MKNKRKNYISLLIWIFALLVIGSVIGSSLKTEVNTWYITINRSFLTPPDYIFGIAWTILYTLIAVCGWIIWKNKIFTKLNLVKIFYIIQLILNWSWTPLFFHYHLIGLSLLCLVSMDIIVAIIICFSYKNMKLISLLMIPYLLWLLFATYLNFYIWQYN